MSKKSGYLPVPPRDWSRVLNNPYCIYSPQFSQDDYTNNKVYSSFLNREITTGESIEINKILNKANILQYRNCNANMSRKMLFSKLAQGTKIGPKKTYATQTLTYSNPNMNSLQRVQSNSIDLEGTNFQTDILSPWKCGTSNVIEDGGHLVCNKVVNPCTNDIIKVYKKRNCFPITDSGIPGFSVPGVTRFLCWNSKIQTYNPRRKLTNSNSGNKWPQNYKNFQQACKPI